MFPCNVFEGRGNVESTPCFCLLAAFSALGGKEERGGVVGLGAFSWEGRGWGVGGAAGDWQPDLVRLNSLSCTGNK